MIFNKLDIFVVFLYLIGCLFVGLYKSTKIKTLEEYSLGRTQYPSTIMTATVFATSISSYSTIGTIEKICNLGFFFVLTFITKPVFFLVSGNILSKNIDKFKGCLSITDIFEVLYGKASKITVSILSLIMCMGMVAIQIYAVSVILQALGMDSLFGTIISFIVLICYSSIGGMRAVAFTDLFQFLVFFVALPIICSNGFLEVGGFSGIYRTLGTTYFNFDLSIQEWILFIGILVFNSIPSLAPPIIQRSLMVNTKKNVLKIFNTNALLCIPFFLIIALVGIIIKIKCSGTNELEQDIIRAFACGLPNGLVGLVVSGLLAIIMSTADSYLNTASIIFTKDILRGLFNKQETLKHAKLSSFILGVISIPIALKGMNIVDFFWSLSGLWSPVIFVPMLVGYYELCPTNGNLFLYSAVGGVLFSILGFLVCGSLGPISTVLGVAGSALAVFVYIFFSTNKKDNSPIKKSYYFKTIDDCLLLIMLLIFISLPTFFLFNSAVFKWLTVGVIIGSTVAAIVDWVYFKNKDQRFGGIVAITSILFVWLFSIYHLSGGKMFFWVALPVSIIMFSLISSAIEVFLLSIFASTLILATSNLFLFEAVGFSIKSNGFVLAIYFFIGFFVVAYIKNYKSYKIKDRENLCFLLEKSKTELTKLRNKLSDLTEAEQTLEKRIENNKIFFETMSQHFQKQEIAKFLQHNDQKHLVNCLPIILFGKNKQEEIAFDAIIEDLENIMFFEAKKEKIKVQLINKIQNKINININNAAVYQMLYSLFYNIIAILKTEAEINILFLQTKSVLEISIEYSGYGLSKKDLIEYSNGKIHINPFLLNWNKLFESFSFHDITCNIEKSKNGGKIKLTKYLISNILGLDQFRTQNIEQLL